MGERGWLIRLDAEQKLRPPLSWSNGALEKPRVINTVDFGVLEVAKPYLLASNYDKNYHKLAVSLNLDVFPAVMLVRDGVLYLGKWSGGGVEVKEYSVQLSPSNPDDDDDPSCSKTIKANDYDDVIFYQGKFCAVSQSGKLAAMDSSFKWKVIAFPVSTSMWWKKEKKKNLVESLGELLLVERHGSTFVAKHCSVEDMLKNEVKFKVYKLDGVRKQWVEMKGSDLDDRIFFVGEDCCFSVSTRDFPGCQRNCMYFCYEVWCGKNVISSRIGVFHLDVGRGSPLEASANIFLPPP
ncbi:hypothetical protein RchiOBHm_Chr2g0097161 [Rosa chinensis]|uniref:KIB1-4 beta-propeller domain-containing protein n=1 Tax=Rosa chinensis TaxID=74649 RepID=A0A2P6RL94_ROSCH|nr:F-box protein At4g35733 [Rosa chinensis]PRQ47204.1 hypothetical protein RchiOBHm_Chr2g0097161 [Rosa chinensis]